MDTPITLIIIAGTCLISWRCFKDMSLFNRLSHRPYIEHRHYEYHRLLSSGFVHGSIGHLFINMYVLYQFGGLLESFLVYDRGELMGRLMYIGFYMIAIIFANMGTFVSQKDNAHFASIGASGVTSATVFIYALFAPWQMFLFPPVPAIVFAVLYIAYSAWASKQKRDNIDHQAHLWGAIFGVLFFFIAFNDMWPSTLYQLMHPTVGF